MAATVLVAGVPVAEVLAGSSVLLRGAHTVAEADSARGLLRQLAEGDTRLVVLGPDLPDLGLAETLRRVRASPLTRRVSLLALLPAGAPSETAGQLIAAGANAVLQRPHDPLRLDAWMTRLMSVPRRLEVRVPVDGQVVGARRDSAGGYFTGLTRNVSLNGALLASPVPLPVGADLDLEFSLSAAYPRFKAVARVVRPAREVAWPHLGYGVEFVLVPPDSQAALAAFLVAGAPVEPAASVHAIRSTVRRGEWVYEVLSPQATAQGWQAEIRRAPRDLWRPGIAGPFYVVSGVSAEETLQAARAFIERHG